MYATAVGLVLYGSKNIKKDEFPKKDKMPFDNVLKRMKEWMIKFF
jgi:hypothetical protein